IGDSEANPDSMENHGSRPEVIAALARTTGFAVRKSFTLNLPMLYVALPQKQRDSVVAIVRAAVPLTAMAEIISSVHRHILIAAVLLALIGALFAWAASRMVSRPIETIAARALLVAGKPALPAHKNGGEVGQLADALDSMASRLTAQLAQITRQKNEQEAVLASMVEGVVALDAEEKIIQLNRAAAMLLNLDPQKAYGKWLSEIIRNSELLAFIARTFKTETITEGDLVLNGPGQQQRFVQVHGSALRATDGTRLGALIVLNDITRLKRLETIRRDFVANVSHELKTPLTSIKGFVETVLNDPDMPAPEARRMLTIVNEQSDRINAIIDDLLSLARLEQDSQQGEIVRESTALKVLAQRAIAACAALAAKKSMRLTLEAAQDFVATVNASLLEEALVNLIDNAVKYSEPGRAVAIAVGGDENENTIAVTDEGIGIPQQHLDRLCERFYRVDKARSRDSGGTGLGLSIVKHIMLVHGGCVSIVSAPGKGSTFTLHLPRRAAGSVS
ncbi:MAG: ATP-binding protein, partial [Chitinivibrionales bacterium]|nr:ATP-binding protein [Chitinivibrionales bacterium]